MKSAPLRPSREPSPRPWVALVAVGALLVLGGQVDLPILSQAASWTSLEFLPAETRNQFGHLLTIPAGALIVVFVRVTLGLRVLGPFRPILMAVALQFTGALVGLGFLAATFLLMVVLRPALRRQRLPYFSRAALSLSTVALFTLLVIVAGYRLNLTALEAIAHFPIVVLCLAAESFAYTADNEGARSALWRAAITAATALAINAVVLWPGVSEFLLANPALLLVQIGAIALMTRTMGFRALETLNPKPANAAEKPFPRPPSAKRRRKSDRSSNTRGAPQAIGLTEDDSRQRTKEDML